MININLSVVETHCGQTCIYVYATPYVYANDYDVHNNRVDNRHENNNRYV